MAGGDTTLSERLAGARDASRIATVVVSWLSGRDDVDLDDPATLPQTFVRNRAVSSYRGQLGSVLDWALHHAPACRRFEYDVPGAVRAPAGTASLYDESRPDGEVVRRWWVVDDALLLLCDEHGWKVHVLGRTRAGIEGVVPGGSQFSEWRSVERAMEPETDNWWYPTEAFAGTVGADAGRDLVREVFAITDDRPIDALIAFLDLWYGFEVPDETEWEPGLPTALAILRSLPVSLIRSCSLLLDPLEEAFDGHPGRFLAESQFLWTASYEDLGPDPLVTLDEEGDVTPLTCTVGQLLLRTLLDEATFSAPTRGTVTHAEPEQITASVAAFARLEPPGRRWPAVLTDGSVLALARDGFPIGSLHFGAHARDKIVASPIGALPRLEWTYADSGRSVSPQFQAGAAPFLQVFREMTGFDPEDPNPHLPE